MALTRFLKIIFAFLSACIATFEAVFKIYYLMLMLITAFVELAATELWIKALNYILRLTIVHAKLIDLS